MKRSVLLPMWKIERNAIEAHASTNHFYDIYLPYEFHQRMVVTAAKRFREVGEAICQMYGEVWYGDIPEVGKFLKHLKPVQMVFEHLEGGAWFHDGIEDVRLNFNSIISLTNADAKGGPGKMMKPKPMTIDNPNCDIVIPMIARAVTSDPTGINRETRMHDGVYQRIRETPGATFTKFADRIGNVQYGVMAGREGGMARKYMRENENFLKKLSSTKEFDLCAPMIQDLENLFTQI